MKLLIAVVVLVTFSAVFAQETSPEPEPSPPAERVFPEFDRTCEERKEVLRGLAKLNFNQAAVRFFLLKVMQ